MPPTDDKAAAAQRIQELYKDDMDMMVILLASLTTLGNAEFLDLCKVWGTLFGSPAEKPYLDRVLSGRSASAAGLCVESTTGSGVIAASGQLMEVATKMVAVVKEAMMEEVTKMTKVADSAKDAMMEAATKMTEVSAHKAGEAPGDDGEGTGECGIEALGHGGNTRASSNSSRSSCGATGGSSKQAGSSMQAGSSNGNGEKAGGDRSKQAGSSMQAGSSNGNGEKAGGDSSKRAGSSCDSRTSSSDSGSSGGESFDDDEGLLEAAQDNYFAQACMSILRLPAVYKGLLKQDAPPISFQPPTREELRENFAAMLVKAKLDADQGQ
ncbi:hypothetical protein Vretifemale_19887 [Volvox reticuliferus]|uniref:Uncharacterized protein n=1 Tax=Volvox reticuliferus TaxID=1737510 RepID=A0A8J4CZW5_9CHLO|nr:hypothetical protein Vretifemale_19887 [Volvox reticuliferus]